MALLAKLLQSDFTVENLNVDNNIFNGNACCSSVLQAGADQ
jgi:hypothetical protein